MEKSVGVQSESHTAIFCGVSMAAETFVPHIKALLHNVKGSMQHKDLPTELRVENEK